MFYLCSMKSIVNTSTWVRRFIFLFFVLYPVWYPECSFNPYRENNINMYEKAYTRLNYEALCVNVFVL